MPSMEWSKALIVGFTDMDKDHRQLVAILNDFDNALRYKTGRDETGKILTDLMEYVRWHCGHEERLMQEHGYDALDTHREEHRHLADTAEGLLTQFTSGDDSALDGLVPFLEEWLANHLHGADKRLGEFLSEHA